jgi:peptidylprolyl isomerase
MSSAKKGDTVRVHYTGRLRDGDLVGSSKQHDPVEIILGAGQIIPGIEKAIEGMEPGETRSVDVDAGDAYGQRQADKIVVFERDKLPAGMEPEVGEQLNLQTHDGESVPAVVTDTSESSVTLDANHPLAGHDLTFELELVEIV